MTTLCRTLRIALLVAVLWAGALPARAQSPVATPAPVGTIPPSGAGTAGAPEDPRAAQVEALLAAMSPADRVGQLFVITFEGNDTSFESDIAELIYAYRVGGVVLSPENRNFSNEPGTDTPLRVATLVNQLQAIAYGILLPPEAALQPVPNEPWPPSNLVALERETGVAPPNLPLMVGVEQPGDNLPRTALRRGFTPLPSQLAIGAAWEPQLAEEIGALVGRELRAVGVNLLLGPNLDVIDQPLPAQVGGMGVFSFGGNPDWVSRMASAYVAGVHAGSEGRLATFVRHFPGQGNIDRMPEEEVATIQKSVEELRAVALPPFRAVTAPRTDGDASGDPTGDPAAAATDGMIVSNMQFSALQGADSQGMPLSLDPNLPRIVADAGLAEWRAAGGLLMSGPLGVPAVRKYYDPAEADFPARRLALDAFTSGHDLLFLDQYGSDGTYQSQLDNVRATIAFFQERYRSDADFAAQVDAAVRRILRLKLRLYGTQADALPGAGAPPLIPLSRVLVATENLAVLPGNGAPADPTPAQVAREAITVLAPDLAAGESLPPAPQLGDQLLIITDIRLQQECADCPAEASVDPDAIARIILQLYGPEATGQIQPEQLTSITFADLLEVLESTGDAPDAGSAPGAELTPAAADATPATATPAVPAATDAAPDAPLAEGVPAPGSVPEKTERIEAAIARADWLIFAMLDVTALHPSSTALSRFLSERSDEVRDKRVVVLALNAPYFLDGTEISKLSAYYGVYSKTQAFLDSGVRAIFRSFSPTGAPPVSVPGTPYRDLTERLSPAPGQVLALRVLLGDELIAANGAPADGEERSAPSVVNVGDAIRIEVGPIFDANGHVVPDGTRVSFDVRFEGAELALPVEPVGTRAGVAAAQVTLERGGVLRVAAQAGAATSGDPVLLNVIEAQPEPTAAAPLVITTTAPVTGGVAPSEPVTATVPSDEGPAAAMESGRRVDGVTLLLSLFTIVLTTALFLLSQTRAFSRERFFKGALWATIAGLLAYIIYGAGVLPWGDWVADHLSIFGAPAIVFFTMLVPLLWLEIRSSRRT
jgi:beta-N-acetylhexosaminidase